MTLDYEVYKEGGLLKDRYQKLEDISEGSYGYVSLATDTKLKKLVAVKYIFKNNDGDTETQDGGYDSNHGTYSSVDKKLQIIKHQESLVSDKVKSRFSNNICFEALCEVDIQTRVGKHKNITELYDFFDSYIIMEYCSGGDLYEAIKAGLVPKKTKHVTHIVSQIMDAIEFVHGKGIYHRDIKPENILISGSNWTVKLTDWGLATIEKTSLNRNIGSERYMAPELFESNLDDEEAAEPYDCAKVDIWAIGIVLLNIVFHKNPFSVANQTDKAFCYFAANREALFDVFSTMSYDFFQVLRYSLTIDPMNRDLSSMRSELQKLGEYTLDDEYYNSLDEEIYDCSIGERESTISYSKQISDMESTTGTVSRVTVEQITPASSKKENNPIPRFTFEKRSHPKNLHTNNQYHIQHNTHYQHNKKSKPIKIDNKQKIIKNSRKPLAIPTPNTHINNFFSEYKSKEENQQKFNTRDFFTPPSVHNRYIEGAFNKKHRPKSKNSFTGGNDFCKPGSFNGHTVSKNYGNGSCGNARRGSLVSQNSPTTGKYIPPHSRSMFQNSGNSPNGPNVGGTFDTSHVPPTTTTFHEQHRLSIDNEPDLDDILFTLEENDVDNNFVSYMDHLKIHDVDISKPSSQEGINSNGTSNDMPDLLKSSNVSHSNYDCAFRNSNDNHIHRDIRPNTDPKYKPGIYIPPHHRKHLSQPDINNNASSNNRNSETTLSVNCNGVTYDSVSTHRPSFGSNAGRRRFSSVNHSLNTPFRRPFITQNHSTSTTAVQHNDIFADTNALVFEDDENLNELADKRSMFGPHDIYKKTVQTGKHRTGRKSSSIQDELVGSLEQYKNNWLMLQQHQD